MNEVAVVILNYNGESLLPLFLPSVVTHSQEAKICVIDNHSSDRSLEVLKRDFPEVQVIELPGNLGFAGGYNAGLTQIQSRYYVLLNSDVEVTPGWLQPFISLFESDPRAAAAQPKVLAHHHRNMFEYAGAAGGFIDKYGYPFCRGRIFDFTEEDHSQYNDTRKVFWATGACLFIRSEVYHAQGGFDEDFFAHMEEIDLCWRIQRSGYHVFYVGNSTVYHKGGGTLSGTHPRKTYYNFRNGFNLLVKNLGGNELIYKLPIRVSLDLMACLVFLLQGKSSHSWAVLKAYGAIFTRWRGTLRKRNDLKKELISFRVKLIYPRSIVADFFLRGKKKFTDLEKI